MDILGFEKPQGVYRRVLWDVSSLEIAVHAPVPKGKTEVVAEWGWPDERQSWTWDGWDPKNFEQMQVNIYSKLASVELFLNGRSLGKQSGLESSRFTVCLSIFHPKLVYWLATVANSIEMKATYKVNFVPGNLTALGFDTKGSQVVARTFLSAGKPAALLLTSDRHAISAGDLNDLAYVRVEAIDERGVRCAQATFPVSFSLIGSGASLEAVANGDPRAVQSVATRSVGLWRGTALAIVRPVPGQQLSGKVTLLAEGNGLRGEVEIRLERL